MVRARPAAVVWAQCQQASLPAMQSHEPLISLTRRSLGLLALAASCPCCPGHAKASAWDYGGRMAAHLQLPLPWPSAACVGLAVQATRDQLRGVACVQMAGAL